MSVAAPPRPAQRPPAPQPGSRFVLGGIRWPTYSALLADLGDHSPLRVTFDRGRLQIVSPLPEHELYKVQLTLFVRELALAARVPFKCLGSMTVRREDLERGLEPDGCFYLASWPRIRGKRTLDFTTDPPPDLALEIDITSSSLDRMDVYAALGVPEVWRFDGDTLRGYRLNALGAYEEQPASRWFPFAAFAAIRPFLEPIYDEDEATLTERFRAWVRHQLGSAGP